LKITFPYADKTTGCWMVLGWKRVFYACGRLRCSFPEVLDRYHPRHSPEDGQGSRVLSEGRVSPGGWMDQKGRAGGDGGGDGSGGGVSHRRALHSPETAGRAGAGRWEEQAGAPFRKG